MIYIVLFLSVMLGYGIAVFLKPSDKRNLKLLLAFSGSFLLSITVMHLIPELYTDGYDGHLAHTGHTASVRTLGICIMAGIVFQIILEYFSKGAEHGHVHGHGHLNHAPWGLFISLCLHAFLEGFAVQGSDVAFGIAVHHLPISIILTSFFLNAGLRSGKIFFFMIAFAAMTPLGAYVSVTFPPLFEFHRELTAIVIGILFHISSTIIFEASEDHKFNITKISMIVLGIVLAAFL